MAHVGATSSVSVSLTNEMPRKFGQGSAFICVTSTPKDFLLTRTQAADHLAACNDLLILTIGNAGNVNRVRPIVTGEIQAQSIEQVGCEITFGLLELDLHA